MEHQNYNQGKSGFGGFVFGVLAALGITYLIKKKMSPGQKLKAKGRMLKMRGEIMDKMENVKDVSVEAYDEVVDAVAEKFEDLKNVDKEDLEKFADKLKRKWRWLQKFKEA